MAKVILDWDEKYKTAIIVSDFLPAIRARFSIPNTSKEMLKKQGKPTWYMPDFVSPITTGGKFGIGLYFELITFFTKDNVDYQIITTDLLEKQIIQTYEWNDNYIIDSLNMELRPYQESSVKKCIRMGYGIVIVGTAGGKTCIMASLIQTIRAKEAPFTTLVILPSNLLQQTYKEFLSYGIDPELMSTWGGDGGFIKKPIVLASIEILRANLTTFSERKPKTEYAWKSDCICKLSIKPCKNKCKYGYEKETCTNKVSTQTYKEYLDIFSNEEKARKKSWAARRKDTLDQLSDVELVLIDEIHSLRRGNVMNEVVGLFSTRHRFGFTGTLPSDIIDQWNIMGNIGPILIDVDSAALRKMDYIAQVKAQILQIQYKTKLRVNIDQNDPTKAFNEECEFIYKNKFRNRVMLKLCNSFENNALIMVDKIDHGRRIAKYIRNNLKDKQVYWIRGSVEMEDRERIRALMETNNNVVCVAMSRIFAVGINIKNLHYVVFAQGGKAKVTLIQSIGRGLRLHDNKVCLIIIDIADMLHYGTKHLLERLDYYKDEQIEHETKELYE